jgi:hypothetical protein
MAQLRNSAEAPFLPSSASDCDCIVNATLHEFQSPSITSDDHNEDDGLFAIFYRISYIYYSMIGTLLTVLFGLIISFITDTHSQPTLDDYAMPKNPVLAALDDSHEGGFRTPGHFSIASFRSLVAHRRVSSFIHNVSQTTLKVENKLKEVISHTHLHHLHVPGDDEERVSILSEQDDASEGSSGGKHKRKMFFIGHQDDREHDE